VRRALGLAALGACVAAAVLALAGTPLAERAELATVDARFDLRGAHPRGDVVVVAIDDRTFSDLRRQWPFPRGLHARVIDRMRAAGARRIAYDVQFTEATTPRQDMALYDAAARARGIVLATTEVDAHGRTNVLGGDANLREIGAVAGNALLPSSGAVLRRLPREIDGLRSFAWTAAGARSGPDDAWIDYQGPPGTIRTVSFSDVLRGRIPASVFRGRLVVVGASAPSLQDVHPTSTTGRELMSGPEVQANGISTALRGFPLRDAAGWIGAVAVVVLALAIPLAATWLALWMLAPLTLALGAGWIAAAWLAFLHDRVVPVVGPLAALAAAAAMALAVRGASEALARQRTRALLARFVGEHVLAEVLERSGGGARLGGVRQVSTVLFCDLRGFTEFAETLPAERVIEVLNRYFTEIGEAVLDHGGTLVTYLGDGIMAVFGSPIERPDHAACAFAAAREMSGPRLERFNAWLAAEGLGGPLALGIGLSTGPVMSGTVGSARRLEYAAVGDTTNVAARLQAVAKQRPEHIILSDATREQLVDDAGLTCLGSVELPGRRASLIAWAFGESPFDSCPAPGHASPSASSSRSPSPA
jgi:adenylate cyclase